MKLDEIIKNITIESFDINGYGICHIDSKVVFVKNAAEGELVDIKIVNIHKKYAFAECVNVINPSPNRIMSLEEISKYGGECDLLFVDYETELKIKQNKVAQTLKKFDYKLNPIIKSNKIHNYRNKVMVPYQRINIEDEELTDVIYGFYEAKSHNIISNENDILANEDASKILYLISRYLVLFNISIYDEITHKGIFREVMIRNTKDNDIMVTLIVTSDYNFDRLIEILISEIPNIKSIYLNINQNNNNVLLSDNFKHIYGDKTITEDILGLKFEVYPASFLQVNHDQCEKLYKEAYRVAKLDNTMNVIDAYCGIGTISLNAAKIANHVYGIEIVEAAIKNANNNKSLNNINNATFICGPCEEQITKLKDKSIDLVFFDPPRKGCDKKFIDTIVNMGIPKIVYVSCNVATLARDVEILEQNGYKLIEATPVDMFSRTSHCEVVACLERVK